jgi:cytochrome c-type biogenesis protein CcmE
MVKMGSLERGDRLQVRFEVTDGNKDISGQFRLPRSAHRSR